MKRVDILVPSLGESITEATISKWFKKKGDNVLKDEVILELETDKVSQEIYALENGSLIEIFFQEGEDVKIGDTLASIETLNKPELKNEEKKPNKVQEKSLLKNEPELNQQKDNKYSIINYFKDFF